MRHLGDIGDHKAARVVLAQGHGQAGRIFARLRAFQHFAQVYVFPLVVGHFHAHGVLARNGRFDAHAHGGQVEGDVVRQRGDAADLDARRGFEFKPRDRRAMRHAGEPGFHAEAAQRLFQALGLCRVRIARILRSAGLYRGEQLDGRIAVFLLALFVRRSGFRRACRPGRFCRFAGLVVVLKLDGHGFNLGQWGRGCFGRFFPRATHALPGAFRFFRPRRFWCARALHAGNFLLTIRTGHKGLPRGARAVAHGRGFRSHFGEGRNVRRNGRKDAVLFPRAPVAPAAGNILNVHAAHNGRIRGPRAAFGTRRSAVFLHVFAHVSGEFRNGNLLHQHQIHQGDEHHGNARAPRAQERIQRPGEHRTQRARARARVIRRRHKIEKSLHRDARGERVRHKKMREAKRARGEQRDAHHAQRRNAPVAAAKRQ